MIAPDDFYVTLPSNARLGKRNDNRPGRFESKLPVTYDMSGEWQTALTSIIFPKPLLFPININETTGYFIISIKATQEVFGLVKATDDNYLQSRDQHIQQGFEDTGKAFHEKPRKIIIRKFKLDTTKQFADANEIAAYINSEFKRVVTRYNTLSENTVIPKNEIVANCEWKLSTLTNTLVSDIGNVRNNGSIYICFKDKSLGYALGYKEFHYLNYGNNNVGVIFDVANAITPLLPKQLSPIFIYMDILKDSIVGDVLCPKLAVVPTFSDKSFKQSEHEYFSPARLEYVDVNKSELNVIHTSMCDCFGNEVIFVDEDMPVIIGLHFRRRQTI